MVDRTTLRLERTGGWLHIWLNRPNRRNAMNRAMLLALLDVFAEVQNDRSVRAIVLRGEGGHFCAGGDIADMVQAAADTTSDHDGVAAFNRLFGRLMETVDSAPAAVIAVCEGAVMGGGFGLACVADLTIAVDGARFALPETSMGIPPAQIAPFVVRRIGLSQARRLAVTGANLTAADALRLGLAHEQVAAEGLDPLLAHVLRQIRACEPTAVAETKAIMQAVGTAPLHHLLDDAATTFAHLARGEPAQAGMMARLSKTPPPWDTD